MGKVGKGWIVRMDVASVPTGIDIDKWHEILTNHGVIVYDSTQGETPVFIDSEGNDIKIVDYEVWNSKQEKDETI